MKKHILLILLIINLNVFGMELTPEQQLLNAAKKGNTDLVIEFIRKGAEIDTRNIDQQTPLMLAAKKGHANICTILIDHGADIHAHDAQDRNLIQICMHKENDRIIELLIRNGANPNATPNELSPIHCAAGLQFQDRCLFLLSHGADPLLIDSHGNTLLHHAASTNIRGILFDNRKNICSLILNYLNQTYHPIFIALCCLKRLKNQGQPCPALLYRQFKSLILPYTGFISITKLLAMKNDEDKIAFDYLPIDILDPEKVFNVLDRKNNSGWFNNCTIQ